MECKYLYAAALLLFSLSLPTKSFSQINSEEELSEKAVQLALEDVRQARETDFKLAPLKNKADLNSYLLNKPIDSPLNAMPATAARQFFESLEFNEKGVTTFSYRELSGLTASRVYAILSLVGIQSATQSVPGLLIENDADRAIMAPRNITPQMKADYDDYRCEARATCTQALTKICTGNC
ncbi:hypothetical protein [Xanthomonas oryzae]|uniref:hypothetical protein n=1 Tax=Xanthomonas oryzae TaxID=347 RepID=UPI0011AB740C|nr:hypothetical protein [Xanthomonas oryzae]